MKIIKARHGEKIIVDDHWYEVLSSHTWWIVDGYAYTTINRKNIYMHRWVNGTPPKLSTDHKNRNRLDNRESNLRTADIMDNNQNKEYKNKTKFRGVQKDWNRYRAEAYYKGKTYRVKGGFDTPEEAAYHRDILSYQLQGDKSFLNFPEKIEEYKKRLESESQIKSTPR